MSGSIENYQKDTRKILEELTKMEKEWKGRDRMSKVKDLFLLVAWMMRSNSGWLDWIKNPVAMEGYKDEELNDILEAFTKACRLVVDKDIKYTGEVMTNTRKDNMSVI